MPEGQRNLIKLFLQELHALVLFNNSALNKPKQSL